MDEMANGTTGISTDVFVERWARKWSATQTINHFVVPAHAGVADAILDATNGFLKTDGTLDWSKAPFQLLAIMNRNDLRDNPLYSASNGGEARFIFGLIDLSTCTAKPMTVIFEFGIRQTGCLTLQSWTNQWLNLQTMPLGSATYNSALEKITVQFTERGSDPNQLPNHSSLNQIRTNEQLGSTAWELRQFFLSSEDPDGGLLRQVTVGLTPDLTLNETPAVAAFVNANAAAIITDNYRMPLDFAGSPFLGGSAVMPANMVWDGPAKAITTPDSRFHFSLNTCNACHSGETATNFQHVAWATPPTPLRQLSKFMTGDPFSIDGNFHKTDKEGIDRAFNDLMRRRVSMAQAADEACYLGIFFDPLGMTD